MLQGHSAKEDGRFRAARKQRRLVWNACAAMVERLEDRRLLSFAAGLAGTPGPLTTNGGQATDTFEVTTTGSVSASSETIYADANGLDTGSATFAPPTSNRKQIK